MNRRTVFGICLIVAMTLEVLIAAGQFATLPSIAASHDSSGKSENAVGEAANSAFQNPSNQVVSPSVSNPFGIVSSFPVVITNNQGSTGPSFQQMVRIDSAQFSSLEAPNLQNVEFFYSNGTVIPSWLESGNSNSATNTVYWLNIAGGIPANSSITVNLGFASPATNLFNAQTTGEAPQLSPTYGQYDDGAAVFTYYQNFAGNACPSGWLCISYGSGSAAISNGATVVETPTGTSFGSIVTANSFSPSQSTILDALSNIHDSAGGANIVGYADCGIQYNPGSGPPPSGCSLAFSDMVGWGLWDSRVASCQGTGILPAKVSNIGGQTVANQLCGVPNTSLEGATTIYSIWWQSSSLADFYYNYANTQQITGNNQTNPIQIGMVSGSGTTSTTWIRMRTAPPNGVMPSASLGRTNIAYVTDFGPGVEDTASADFATCGGYPNCGSSVFTNAITGSPPPGGNYTTSRGTATHFTDVPVGTIDTEGLNALASYSTIFLYEVCDIGNHPALLNALNTYLTDGLGKVVIYDGDRCAANQAGTPNYTGFLFPFTSNNPGPLGGSGTINFVENETSPASLTRGVVGSAACPGPLPCFVGGQNDAIGDSNTFTSNTGGWCAGLIGTNTNGVTGIQVAYAKTPAGGLAIYNGQDNHDTYGSSAVFGFDKLVLDNILDQQVKPDSLPCSSSVTGIKLDPLIAINIVGTSHTVTATVNTVTGTQVQPAANITVNFKVVTNGFCGSGTAPNAGVTGTAVTRSNGQASFSYFGAGGVGNDTIIASFNDTLGTTHTSNKACKTWLPSTNQFDFSIAANPSSETVLRGGSASYNISLTIVSGQAQPINVTIAGLPAGTSASLSHNQVVPPTTDNLEISTTLGAALGDFNVTVTGQSGTVSHSISVALHIYDFTITSSLCQQTVLRGGIAPFNLTFTLVNGSSTVNLPPIGIDVSGLPANTTVTMTIPPSNTTITSVTLSKTPVTVEVLIQTYSNTPLGDFPFSLTGVDTRTPEGGTRQVSNCIGGTGGSLFQLHAFYPVISYNCPTTSTAGGSISCTINVSLAPGSSLIKLPELGFRFVGLPLGTFVVCGPQTGVPPFTSVCTLTWPTGSFGTFDFGLSGFVGGMGGGTIGGSPPGGTPGGHLILHVYDFQVTVAQETVLRGGTAVYNVTLSLLPGSSTVGLPTIYLNMSGLSPGFVSSLSRTDGTFLPTGEFTVLLTIRTSNSSPLGDFSFNVSGTDIRPLLGGSRIGTGELHVYDFTIASSPTSSTVTVGGTGTYNETLTLLTGSSTTGLPRIQILIKGLPNSTLTSFDPTAVIPTSAGNLTTLTIHSSAAGTYSLVVIGNDTRVPEGGSRSSLPLSPQTLTVFKASTSIATTVSPSTILAGSAAVDTATLSGGYNPTGSITFRVYYNSASCTSGSLVFTSSNVIVSGNGNYISATGFHPKLAGAYYWTASYSGDSNNNPLTTSCGAAGETLFVSSGQITNTSFCAIPNNQFPLNLITDPQNPAAFELVSTNPGQFYDNIFYSSTAGSNVTLTIGLPFPFVTQGAVPIQVSSSFGLNSGCFSPSFDATGRFTITATGGTLSPSGAPIIMLTDYTTQQLGSYVYVTVTGKTPSTGLVYVTVHMNYGFRTQDLNKIITGTSSGTPSVSCTVNPCAQWFTNNAVIIGSPQPYSFTITGSLSTTSSATSVNNFKKDPGFAGVVTDANGRPIAGATVKIYDSKGNLIGTTTTDQNGIYLFTYKYTGPTTTFTIRITNPTGTNQTQAATMKSNRLVLTSFVI